MFGFEEAEEEPSNELIPLKQLINGDYKNPVMISDNECLVILFKGFHSISLSRNDSGKFRTASNQIPTGIFKYNIHTDNMTHFMDIPSTATLSKLRHTTQHTVDIKHHLLYIMDKSNVMVIDLHTKSITEYPDILKDIKINSTSSIIAVNNQLHIIGHRKHSIHWTFDLKSKTIKQTYEFQRFKDGFYKHTTLYIKSENVWLLIGGIPTRHHHSFKNIYSFCLTQNKWNTKLYASMPDCLTECSCVSTQNDKYILIIGGKNETSQWNQNIYILDTMTKKWSQSLIKCPQRCYGFVVHYNKTKIILLIYGFIRNLYQSFPECLIEEIILRYAPNNCNEMIHLMKGKNHWEIELKTILENAKEVKTYVDNYYVMVQLGASTYQRIRQINEL